MILAESSIELVPPELYTHPAVVASARRKRRPVEQLILDQNYHHSAINRLGTSGQGRGRPDIAHISLLLALGSPMNLDGGLRCYVHTLNDDLVTVDREARLPRNTDRFVSLLEQLYETGGVPPTGKTLLSLGRLKPLDQLVKKELASDLTVALSTKGQQKQMSEVAVDLTQAKNPVLLIGGFPQGHFSKKTLALANSLFSISSHSLEAWTVVSRAVYEYERNSPASNR